MAEPQEALLPLSLTLSDAKMLQAPVLLLALVLTTAGAQPASGTQLLARGLHALPYSCNHLALHPAPCGPCSLRVRPVR